MKNLKGACIGAGYFSQFHFDAWNRIEDVQIEAICDIDISKAKEAAARWNIPQVFDDPKIMLDKIRPDFVDIITPPETHYNLVQLSADLGVSVICQKPLAPSYNEAVSIVDYTAKHGVRFMVHENWRFQPWYRKMKQMVDHNEIGHLHTIHSTMRTGDGWSDNAYLDRQPYFRKMPRLLIYETGIHFIDTFRYLGGPVQSVYAQLRKWNKQIAGEDAGVVHFNFESGAIGLYDGNRYNESSNGNNRYTFGEVFTEGSKGTIRLNSKGILTIQRLGDSIQEVDYNRNERGFAGDCVYETQRHFLDGLLNNRPFETNGHSYLNSLKVQEAVYESAEENMVIQLESEETEKSKNT